MQCHGRLVQEYDDEMLHNQLKYLETLFDMDRYAEKHSSAAVDTYVFQDITAQLLMMLMNFTFYRISIDYREVYQLLKQHMSNAVHGSAYNWITPGLWTQIFGGGLKSNKVVAIKNERK
jgi:hypothetical protein